MTLEADLKAEAFNLGFFLAGIASPTRPVHYPAYLEWLAKGRQAGMSYLSGERARQCREDLHHILEDVRSILVLGLAYDAPGNRPASGEPGGRVAAYARGQDYHEIIPPRLARLASWMENRLSRPIHWRGYTDTGPILERELGQQAGLGWIGKNTCLISSRHGSYFLLAEILWDVDLAPDAPFSHDYCGSCRRCIDACPTACILPDRTLDAGRCISYQTIENKGSIPPDLRPSLGDWVFGCDICQQVCPWNRRFAPEQGDPELSRNSENALPNLQNDLSISQEAFRQRFRHSPLSRPRRRGYQRNVAVVLGNRRDPRDIPALADALLHEGEPLVRAHAAWALGQIGAGAARTVLENALSTEVDDTVRAEINIALSLI